MKKNGLTQEAGALGVLNLLRDILSIAINEFRLLHRNRTAMLISLVILPGFFIFSLGGATGGTDPVGTEPVSMVHIAYVDEDNSEVSSRLLETLLQGGHFNELKLGYTRESSLQSLGTGRIYAVIVVPKGFGEHIRNGQSSTILLYSDDGEPGLSDSVLVHLQEAVSSFDQNTLAELAPDTRQPAVAVIQKGTTFSGFDVGLAIVLGVVQVFATFYEIAGGISRELEEGTYSRLLLSPTNIWSVLLGKTIYDAILGTARSALVISIAIYAYGASPNADFGSLLAISLLIALVTMGVGFVVSSLRISARTVVIMEFLLVILLFAFSGLIIDKELLVGVSSTVADLLPWSYGFEALRRAILLGHSLGELAYPLGVMAGVTVVLYLAAFAMFSRMRERLVG